MGKGFPRSLPVLYRQAALAEGVDPTGARDSAGAINAALASQAEVLLLPGTYLLKSPITIPTSRTLRGSGPLSVLVFSYRGADLTAAVMSGGAGGTVRDLGIDGGSLLTGNNRPFFNTACVKATHNNFKIDNVHAYSWRGQAIWGQSCVGLWINDCDFAPGGEATTIHLEGCIGARVTGNNTSGNNFNFGILLRAGSNKCHVSGNYCNNAAQLALGIKSLEPIGVTWDCFENVISGNHCEGSGDNGISATGFDNSVVGNTVIGNYHNGISVYGSGNVVIGNRCKNNGQRFSVDGTSFPNINVNPGFRGAAQSVVIAGNNCSGGPAECGVKVSPNGHNQWVSGALVSASNASRYFGNNVYSANSLSGDTVAGANAPVHTSGTVSDGNIAWTFVYSGSPDLNPHNCSVYGNVSKGHRVTDRVVDSSGNSDNLISDGGIFSRGLTAGRPVLTATDVGRQFFDTTLGKPVWWNGTVWKDAAGTTV